MKLTIANRFGVTPNNVLTNTGLTFKAKGLYGYLQSKPDGWDFSAKRIAYDSKDGVDGVNSWLQELEKAGFLDRIKTQNEKGFWDIEYVLYENPKLENPVPDNPDQEKPDSEKPVTNKKRKTKKEVSNKESNKGVVNYFPDNLLNTTFLEFIEHRKQLKAPMTSLAITKCINRLKTFEESYGTEKVIGFINLAIESGWKWIFDRSRNDNKPGEKKLSYETQERGKFTF